MDKSVEKKRTAEVSSDEKQRQKEAEAAEIIMHANDVKEETFDFGDDGRLELKNELDDVLREQIDDPEMKYSLYYNVLQRFFKKHLASLEKSGRDLIYEDKNAFLTGKRKSDKGIRHADSRMAYTAKMKELIGIVADWLASKGSLYELYDVIHQKNVADGI